MYKSLPYFILAFHGCDESIKQKVLISQERFWESDPIRALEYAQLLKKYPERSSGKIAYPAVIGAVIDLGRCLNLVESYSLRIVREAYNNLEDEMKKYNKEMPKNHPIETEGDLLIRRLDCLVFEYLHKNKSENEPFDSVRGVFWEGNELYPNAGFKEKNHIQICVRNPNCIKGYFDPLEPLIEYPIP